MYITPEITNLLKYYVYIYTDPRSGNPFYIGKGKGGRVFSHLNENQETEKTRIIEEIRQSGQEPCIDILRYGMTELEAKLVEASAIDLIGLSKLTNKIAGYDSRSFGRIGSSVLISMLSAKSVEVTHKAILITINKQYRSDMTSSELYESTRGIWKVGERREGAEYAMAVYQGIVREVYSINVWYPAGTLEYKTRDSTSFQDSGRWEFDGEVAVSIRNKYLGNNVGMSGQNPIRYMNC